MNFDKLIDYFKLDKKEFYFQFNSHPDYPSALALSDTLNFLGVKNDAYELEKEYWEELPNEFIGIVSGKFSLIKKEDQKVIVFSDDIKKISNSQLLSDSENFIMLLEKQETSRQTRSINYKVFIYILFGILVLYSLLNLNWYETVFNLLSLAGVYISLEIFSQKFGNESAVMNNICGGNPGQNASEGCLKIISSDTTKIFGLKLSDFSLIYFVTLSLLGLLLPHISLIFKIFAVASIAVILYSLYVQIIVEKTFCRICLIIISILLFQLFISLYFLSSEIQMESIFTAAAFAVLAFSGVHYLNGLLKENKDVSESNAKNLRFKRNYDLFRRELLANGQTFFKNPSSDFFIGEKDAPLHVSLISNPYCGFCKEGHEIVEKLLNRYPDKISAQIRFNYLPDKASDELTNLMNDLKNISYSQGSKILMEAIHFWFENRDYGKQQQKFPTQKTWADLSTIIANTQENYDNQLNFTPIILLNGRLFPQMYNREDIFYFIEELLEDEDFMQ